MRKRWFLNAAVLALALALALSAPSALAEPEYGLQMVIGDKYAIKTVANTDYLLVQHAKGGNWRVMNTEGEKLSASDYPGLQYLKYNCLQAAKADINTAKALAEARISNALALVSVNGSQLTDYTYGYFEVYNHYWAGCYIISKGTKEDRDLKLTKTEFYKIIRCDLIYLGGQCINDGDREATAVQIASLQRDEIASAQAHGKYLSVKDRQGHVTVYGPEGIMEAASVSKIDEAIYALRRYCLVNKATGEILGRGYSSVKEAYTKRGMLLIVGKTDYSGVKTYALIDLDGNVLMPASTAVPEAVTADYVLLKNNKLFGLYSINDGKMLLPCEYESIVKNSKSLDPYVSRGFITAKKDGQFCFISADTGEIVRSFAPRKGWGFTGLLYYKQSKSTVDFFSPFDGVHSGFVGKVTSTRGSGYLLSVKTDYKNILYNWQGEMITRGNRYGYTVTDDDHVIARDSDTKLYSVFKLVPVMTPLQ